ncbi:hypothetical protein [Ruania zhangjianzhongii]|uniref:hypothetical protein n=1 Tax=Ruania zhangjianzhongii TaxID=2603206 RepID=UPI0011CB2C6F|nr:hypothetical protein [Ruania zhangjianzhongii]
MTFDVKAYTRAPIDLRPTNLDLTALAGLDPSTLATLGYLWQVEHAVLDLMRDVLVTPTHAESEVTAFLVTWGYEQYWLAETLREVLATNGERTDHSRDAVVGMMLRGWDDRARPMLHSFRTNLLGEQVVAGHLATGWLDTAALALCYRRLAAVVPACSRLTEAVLPMKERHLAFHAAQLQQRIADPAAARHARRAARAWRWPGTRYGGYAAVHPVVEFLFADRAARAPVRAVDEDVQALLDVAPLTPVRSALGRFVR